MSKFNLFHSFTPQIGMQNPFSCAWEFEKKISSWFIIHSLLINIFWRFPGNKLLLCLTVFMLCVIQQYLSIFVILTFCNFHFQPCEWSIFLSFSEWLVVLLYWCNYCTKPRDNIVLCDSEPVLLYYCNASLHFSLDMLNMRFPSILLLLSLLLKQLQFVGFVGKTSAVQYVLYIPIIKNIYPIMKQYLYSLATLKIPRSCCYVKRHILFTLLEWTGKTTRGFGRAPGIRWCEWRGNPWPGRAFMFCFISQDDWNIFLLSMFRAFVSFERHTKAMFIKINLCTITSDCHMYVTI